MLRIRFTRTGKVGQPSFRIVVAPKEVAVKGKYIESVGYYLPARKPKVISIKKERFDYWLSKGAQPSASVASLLKKEGIAGMEKFLKEGKRQKKKKGEPEAQAASTSSEEAKTEKAATS